MRRRRVLIATVLIVGTLLGTQTVAGAVEVQESGYTYISANFAGDCAWSQIWIDNRARPFLQAMATWDQGAGGGQCNVKDFVADTGRLAVKQDLLFWNWNANAWWVCNPGPWQVNDWGPTHAIFTAWGWGPPPCGASWYYGWGYAATRVGNAWHGADRHIAQRNSIWVQ